MGASAHGPRVATSPPRALWTGIKQPSGAVQPDVQLAAAHRRPSSYGLRRRSAAADPVPVSMLKDDTRPARRRIATRKAVLKSEVAFLRSGLTIGSREDSARNQRCPSSLRSARNKLEAIN